MKHLYLALFSLLSVSVNAQISFTRNTTIPAFNNGPLTLAWSGGLNFPLFSEIDLNNDNLVDLFVFDRSNNRVLTFINKGTGTTDCWEYAPDYASKFPVLTGWAFLYDYNCDSKPDILTLRKTNNGISLFLNDSQGSSLHFTLADTTISYYNVGPFPANIFASNLLVPDFNDIDGDGDMDIIGQQFLCSGAYAYYRNMSMEDYGVCDSLDHFAEDQNIWGGFTLRPGAFNHVAVGNYNVTCFLYSGLNEDHTTSPYEIARRDDTYANIHTIDIDGDGDKDALIGDSQANNSLLVINGGTATHAQMIPTGTDTLFPSYNVPVTISSFAAHSNVDCDNDGIKDLVVTQSEFENVKGVLYYKNTGTNAVPSYSFQQRNFLQDEMIDVGEGAAPVFFDYDADGLLDLVIGNIKKSVTDSTTSTGLTLYRNTGTSLAPEFTFITDDYAGLQSLALVGLFYPAFADLDNDGDEDMVIGLDDGKLIHFTNNAGVGNPANFVNQVYNYMNIDVGQAAAPQLIDMNRDGKPDLVIGCKNGFIRYFENLGTPSSPFFPMSATKDTLGSIVLQYSGTSSDGYVVPFVFDQGGTYHLLASNMNGQIYLYGNIEGNLFGTYNLIDSVVFTVAGIRYGYNITVSGADINGDTLVDMIVGMYGGGIQIFYQDDPNTVNSDFDYLHGLSIFPNPSATEFSILLPGASRQMEYIFTDMLGRNLLFGKFDHGSTTVDISRFADGLYFLRLTKGEAAITKKIIIAR